MKVLNIVALFITILGAFNWFLVYVLDYNLVSHLVHGSTARVFYIIIGVASLYCLKFLPVVYRQK
jgi:uncharacterized protein